MGEIVAGFCPMGCGQTLYVPEGDGRVLCARFTCPNPSAVAELLAEPETEHIVVLDGSTFAIQHPLRERLRGELFDCQLHAYLRSLDVPPAAPGRYRTHWAPPGQLVWTRLSAPAIPEVGGGDQ